MLIGTQALDALRVYPLQLAGDKNASLAGRFTGSEVLTARLWAGGSTPTLAAPAVVWLSAALAQIQITVTPADLAGLAPMVYRLVVTIDGDVTAFDGQIKLTAAPGSTPAGRTYVTEADLLDYCSSLEKLQTDVDLAGCLRQRVRATARLDEIIVSRWKTDSQSPSIGQPGYGAWAMYAGNPDSPPSVWLREQLDAGFLVVTPLVREIVAKWAISYVCQDQVARVEKGPWRDMAREFRWEANQLVKTYRAEIDADGDGYAEIVVHCGATNLR